MKIGGENLDKSIFSSHVYGDDLLLFSDRNKIAERYMKYLDDNSNVMDCPLNFITWCYGIGILDVSKVKEYINRK